MIPFIMLALAAATDAPKRLKPIFTLDDYPLEAVRKGEQGEVVADLLINPEGAVETCEILLSSGFADLDQATCTLLRNRALFTPARDEAGHPMYALVRTPPVTWTLGSFRGASVGPDYDLLVNRAPDGAKLPVEFSVDYTVSQDGKAQNCVSSKLAPAALVNIACRMITSAPAQPIRDRNGRPVEVRDEATFRFSKDEAKGSN